MKDLGILRRNLPRGAPVDVFATDEAYYAVQGKNPDGTDNPALDVHVDVDNLIDYMISNLYGGNSDWHG